ncbi:hypothetical protein F8M41_016803 [Gigaspora margarita]|uniref:Uncharacterized protein n=1 Tax=Gigaspora margarita TaxID=4874 RepID=A0A8H4AP06_GIGMA|nr:hypothetical protein F8M41_016803 [Gigaspora margarita]
MIESGLEKATFIMIDKLTKGMKIVTKNDHGKKNNLLDIVISKGLKEDEPSEAKSWRVNIEEDKDHDEVADDFSHVDAAYNHRCYCDSGDRMEDNEVEFGNNGMKLQIVELNNEAHDYNYDDENLETEDDDEMDTCKTLYQHRMMVELGLKYIAKVM